MPKYRALTLVLWLLCTGPAAALADHIENCGPGFLHIRPRSTGQSFRTTLPPILPGSIRPGWSLVSAATPSNIWISEPDLNLDYEALDRHLSLAYGSDEHFGLMVMYDQREYFGGVPDAIIRDFHDLFDMDQDGRDKVPRGDIRLILFDSAYQQFSQTGIPGLRFTEDAATVMTDLAWRTTPDIAVLIQYLYNDGVVENYGQLDQASHEVDAGFKLRLSSTGALDVAVLENIFTFDNGPDLGFHVGYKQQF